MPESTTIANRTNSTKVIVEYTKQGESSPTKIEIDPPGSYPDIKICEDISKENLPFLDLDDAEHNTEVTITYEGVTNEKYFVIKLEKGLKNLQLKFTYTKDPGDGATVTWGEDH